MAATVKAAVRRVMNTLDANAESIGSGPYNEMAMGLKEISECSDEFREAHEAAYGAIIACEYPGAVNTTKVMRYLKDPDWLHEVIVAKRREHEHLIAQGQPRLATMMTKTWMSAMARAAMDRNSLLDEMGLCKMRWSVYALFKMRVGFLTHVTNRLNEVKITPQMLFPLCFGVEPLEGDPGNGPTARECLMVEPQFLRWVLSAFWQPWPEAEDNRWTAQQKEMIRAANYAVTEALANGDGGRVNDPCPCAMCGHTNFRFVPYGKRQCDFEDTFPILHPIEHFPPMQGVQFREPEECDLATWMDRRLMRDRCTNPFNRDKPTWYLSRSAHRLLHVQGHWCEYAKLYTQTAGNVDAKTMRTYEDEFLKVLKEAEEAGYADSVGARVRARERGTRKRPRAGPSDP